MARLNVAQKTDAVLTHEGAPAYPHMTAEQALRRSVMACMLWEDEFYEDGKSIADRITENASKVSPEVLAKIAIEAREVMNLRHVPLLLLDALSKSGPHLMAETTARVIQRVDEIPELLAIYWRNGRKMVPHQMQRGLAQAFTKFDEYQFAKYDRDSKVKLRDALRLARPKPKDEDQSALFKKIKDRALKTPDTWEVELSAGKDKKETFERLLREGKLGYLALLRNLRNMAQANVDVDLVREAIVARKGGAQRVLPFRYVSAARHAPQFEPYLDKALLKAIDDLPILKGRTVVCVDVSGSMRAKVSGKSEISSADAAAALASIINGDVRVIAFGTNAHEVPARRGMSGVDVINSAENKYGLGYGTNIGLAVQMANGMQPDRVIVITDEQSHDRVPPPACGRAYMINVASYKNGVGYGKWMHIDGFSEGVLRYITAMEND